MIDADGGLEATLDPPAAFATTVNVYAVEAVRPVNEPPDVRVCVVVVDAGDDVTLYDVIVPLGAVHVTVAVF